VYTAICQHCRGYEMSPGRALSRDSCPAKTTSAKARKIENLTQNRLEKKEPVPEGVAMSKLSNGTKKHTSNSRETIPLNANEIAVFSQSEIRKKRNNKKIRTSAKIAKLMFNFFLLLIREL
jgi:hypothetical protein